MPLPPTTRPPDLATSEPPQWRGPPGHHQCLDYDGVVRWVPDTPAFERQRALEKTLTAQGMPDEAIETILWMDNERRLRDTSEDAEPVEKRTRKRRPTIASVVRQLQRAGVEVAGVEISDGAIKVLSGKPVGNVELDDASPDPRWN